MGPQTYRSAQDARHARAMDARTADRAASDRRAYAHDCHGPACRFPWHPGAGPSGHYRDGAR